MAYLEVNGTPVALPAESSVQVEHKSPLLTDTLEDSYAPELDIPVRGNERALGHVHQLALRERTTKIEGAHLGHEGVPLFPGTLHTLGSNSQRVRASFVLEGFVAKLAGITLDEALKPVVIDLVQGDEYILYYPPKYREGGALQFPMHRNPSLYPSEARPGWDPSAVEWNSSTAYNVNDLVLFTEHGTVMRTDKWQCVTATSAGESPETHASKWRRTCFALVNAWNKTTGRHYVNSPGNEFYAFVPWFYIKWVLKQALAYVGYRPVGEWMDDPRWDEWLLANTTTIDAKREQTDIEFFQASQTSPRVFSDVSLVRANFSVPGHDESTVPNQDTNALWNNSTHVWTCPAAGVYTIRVMTTMNRVGNWSSADRFNYSKRVRAMLYDENDVLRAEQTLPFVTLLPGGLTCNATFTFTCTGPDVGVDFRVVFWQVEDWEIVNFGGNLPVSNVLWPSQPDDAYSNSVVRGWQENATPSVMTPDQLVHVHRHMPQVDLAGFVQAVLDTWNLEGSPNEVDRTFRLSYKEQVVVQQDRNTTDQSHRQVGEMELQHERATTGVRLQWDVDTNEEPEADVLNAIEVFSEANLSAPITTGEYAVIKSTRELYKSVFRAGTFSWQPAGYHIPPKLVGEQDDPEVRTPALVPLPMVHEQLDGEQYLVPLLDAEGTSAWWHTQGKRDTLWICEFKRANSYGNTVEDVPLARTWGWGWDENDHTASTLLWDSSSADVPGLYQLNWRNWLLMRTNAEPVETTLKVDPAFILDRAWTRPMLLHNQRYLCERLTVDYGRERRLLASPAKLLRMRDGVPVQLPPPAAYSAVDTLRFYAYAATLYFEAGSSSGYVATRGPGGTVVVHGSGDPAPFAVTGTATAGTGITAGWFSFWPSDADGNRTGVFTHFRSTGMWHASLPYMPDLLWLDLRGGHMTNVLLPLLPALQTLDLGDHDILNTDEVINALDPTISGITVWIDGGTSVPRTTLSDAVYNALTDLGGTFYLNT